MILYHGSTDLVAAHEIRRSENYLDFGDGFYTTTSFAQAERWARIKMGRKGTETGYVCVYQFDEAAANSEFRVHRFAGSNMDWLLFVSANRQQRIDNKDCDLHIGPVADDNVYRTIRLFETGVYDAEETIKRLKTEVLHDQWAFHTTEVLRNLRFLEAKEIHQEVAP